MNKYLVSLGLMLAAASVFAGISADNKYLLNNMAGGAQKAQLGTQVDQAGGLSIVWDSSTRNFGSSTIQTGAPNPVTPGDHDLGVLIPKKSLITRGWVEVTV